MRRLSSLLRPRHFRHAAFLAASAAVWSACSDVPDSVAGPDLQVARAVVTAQEVDLGPAIEAQERNARRLLAIPGVVGHAVSVRDGEPVIVVYTRDGGAGGIPERVDGIEVRSVVSGMIVASTDETAKHRPAPLGVSIGHPDITAGTLGFKVEDGAGNAYVLSNNHVMANINQASIGDHILQPGAYDGGTDPADRIGDLADFVPIDFSGGANVVDAAIASVLSSDVLSSTPVDEGYGQPSATTASAFVGMAVQKYGRTTEHTHGTVDAVNGTFNVCYEPIGPLCLLAATFVNQIVISPGEFSAGGDSGSGIVTDDANLNPVALLFAGSSSFTIANPIDAVLSSFDVTIDDGGSEPPAPVTDIGIPSVSAPATVTGGDVAPVTVTVSNSGNQDVAAAITVTLEDGTDGVVIGSQVVNGLTAGASADLAFSWDTNGATFGDHLLVASHDFGDDVPTNDQAGTSVQVTDPSAPSGVHVGDLDVVTSDDGSSWSATVEVAVHGPSHELVNGATVVGAWSESGLASDTCTTGELGGTGTCIFLFTSIPSGTPSVSFTVTDVTLTGETYQAAENHDPDGDSDGTTITAQNPATPNSPPTASDVAASGDEDAASIPWTPSASDPDGDALACSIATQPANGSATVNPDCSGGTYAPDPNFNGLDAFTYSASDGSASDQGTVTVTVSPVNDAPVASGDAYQATVGTPLSEAAPGVLGNDVDVDGDALTAVLDAGPTLASAFSLNADGSFSYTPASAGDDSFTYHAFDGSAASSVVTVTIAVASAEGVTVTDVLPDNASTNSVVAVQITGSGFAAGADVAFENGSGPAPSASDVVVVDGGTLTATVTIKGGGPPRNRVWDVRVTNADGSTGVLSRGFTVTP